MPPIRGLTAILDSQPSDLLTCASHPFIFFTASYKKTPHGETLDASPHSPNPSRHSPFSPPIPRSSLSSLYRTITLTRARASSMPSPRRRPHASSATPPHCSLPRAFSLLTPRGPARETPRPLPPSRRLPPPPCSPVRGR
jgi:hypothetical protein